MADIDPKPTQGHDPVEAWLSGMDAYRDYLRDCLHARSAEDLLDAYSRFLSRCFTLAGDYAQTLAKRPPK